MEINEGDLRALLAATVKYTLDNIRLDTTMVKVDVHRVVATVLAAQPLSSEAAGAAMVPQPAPRPPRVPLWSRELGPPVISTPYGTLCPDQSCMRLAVGINNGTDLIIWCDAGHVHVQDSEHKIRLVHNFASKPR